MMRALDWLLSLILFSREDDAYDRAMERDGDKGWPDK